MFIQISSRFLVACSLLFLLTSCEKEVGLRNFELDYSGKIGNNLWVTGQASADRTSDYQPGKVGSFPNDPKNKLYKVSLDEN